MTHVSELDEFEAGETYAISTKEDLINLATLVNDGIDTIDVTFVMGADIDLSSIANWDAIGVDNGNCFLGTFDGNGHKIINLKINSESITGYQGLFGYIDADAIIKNIGVEGSVKGGYRTGILVGHADGSIQNCYSKGIVSGKECGGLAGYAENCVKNCYSTANVSNTTGTIGGLLGTLEGGNIENCFATGNVTSTRHCVGGLVGYYCGNISNSYATGNVQGKNNVGGLAGAADDGCSNCYATGNVSGENNVGGLFGFALYTVSKSFATGNVSGTTKVGGLVGQSGDSYDFTKISKSYATGNVSGTSQVGGLAGWTFGNTDNCFATGDVEGTDCVGGLIGIISADGYNGGNKIINNIYASGDASGTTSVGTLVGGMNVKYDGKIGTINLTNASVSKEGNAIGGVFENETNFVERDMSDWLDNITVFDNAGSSVMTMQVGISGDNSSQIMFETTLDYDLSEVETNGINSASAYDTISNFLSQLSDKATELGATSNRLESALESTTVAMENLTSSLSTIKDADIAKVSSDYIKKQILQQASATLLATANQSPSIALQLL